MTTPRREASENGFRRPPTPPQDGAVYRTPHLEGLLKRKKIEIDLTKMVKEVKGEKIDWDMETWSTSDSSSDESGEGSEEFKDRDGDVAMTDVEKAAGRERESIRGAESQNKLAVRQEDIGLAIPVAISGRSVSRMSPAPPALLLPMPRAGAQTEQLNRTAAAQKQAAILLNEQGSLKDSRQSSFNTGLDGNYDYDASSSDDEDGYKSDADAHEDVEMEVESTTSHSSEEDHVSPTNTTSFKQHVSLPSTKMGSPSSSPSPNNSSHQLAAVTPISPALSNTTDDAEREMKTPARPQIDLLPTMMTPISPATASLSKQVRFVMPASKNGIRKLGNNPSGVLESGLAKMKFGNVRKGGMFGPGEGR